VSVLSFPRLNFRGQFRCNPCTANNDDVMPDVVTRDSCTLGSNLAGMTDAQIATFLREQVCMANYGDTAPGACTNFLRSGWNLYGNHWTNFQNTTFASVVTGPAPSQRTTDPNADSLIGCSFQLLGSAGDGSSRRGDPVLVDVDPTGLVTSQIWLGGIQINDVNGQLNLNFDTRCYQDWLNFNSTVGAYGGEQNFVGIGCTFQFYIPASAIPDFSWVSSPGLRALLSAATQTGGLVVRFRVYEVEPGLTDEQLSAQFQQGNAAMNYAFGYLVGTIGLWYPSEPVTEPAGRKLTAQYPRPDMAWQSQDGSASGTLPGCPLAWQGPPALIGNVVANVIQDPNQPYVSLDMVNTFPKYGYRNPDGPNTPSAQGFAAVPQMATVGNVSLWVNYDNTTYNLGPVDYGVPDFDDYANFGGIVDIPILPGMLAAVNQGNLLLMGNFDSPLNAGVALVQEQILRVITDNRSMYMPLGVTQFFNVMVTERGGPITQNVTLYLVEYMNIIEVDTVDPKQCVDGFRPNQSTNVRTGGNRLDFPPTVTITAGTTGWVSIMVDPAQGGAALLSFQLDPTVMGPSVPAWTTANYSSVRVYMNDDYSKIIASGEIPWDFVYEEALRYYSVLFPAMSTYIPLDMPDALVAQAPTIQKRLAQPNTPMFDSTYNMPVTRTMSPGKIQLILAWLAQETTKKAAKKAALAKPVT
jgi:hypothetical protein